MPRSGHSANLYNDKMYIFGGIFEITKELSELLVYDFAACSFTCMGGDTHDSGAASAKMGAGDDSPNTLKKRATLKDTKQAA